MVKKLVPSVVLMDIAMPLLNGLEATRQILKAAPTTKVVMLSAHNDDAYVQEATNSGAVGFLIKQSSAQNVCEATREVQKGNTYFSASVGRRLQQQNGSPHNRNGARKQRASLSSREMEVLQLIAEGKANKESASELGISIKTVEKHRENLMSKLNIHDTAGLTRYAISAGIIENSVQVTIV